MFVAEKKDLEITVSKWNHMIHDPLIKLGTQRRLKLQYQEVSFRNSSRKLSCWLLPFGAGPNPGVIARKKSSGVI